MDARIGRYEIVCVLGRGGMGVVYEAVLHGPAGIRKPVALKVLHEGADAIRREARIGGLLRHRHLVDVYEVGEHRGRWFAALELCRGGSLGSHLPLPPRAVVDVGLQVCDALAYAHGELGLVHLDLKPENLLLDGGEVKVADLGVAQARGFDWAARIRGTLGYMAPEQVRGGPLDARADVYALGVTLAELAAGRPLAPGATFELSADAPATPPGPAVPAWLAPVVDRCVEHHPDDRWPDMAAVARALRALPVGGPGLRELLGVREPAEARSSVTNLPPDPDRFVGRSADAAALEVHVTTPGLVLLRGAAGIGKSRLALDVARRWLARDGRQAWFCETSEAQGLSGLVAAVASALAIPLGGGEASAHVDRLGRAIATRGDVLVLLDGFEHLADHAAVIERWRELAPRARIVVTTRSALPLRADAVVEVGPLPTDDAVALLAARALERGVEVSGDPGLAELAARLDGVPLALELAAGRLGVLTVTDVLERLSLSLLTRGTDGRHGTLRAALDWSWDLLDEVERSALAQLSVFAGGFTLEAAEGVLALDHGTPLDVVAALVDRSMVSRAGARFTLLGGIRDYAAERLGDDQGPAVRHARWFSALGTREAIEALGRHGGIARHRALEAERANLAAACRSAVARADGATAVRLMAAVSVLAASGGALDEALDLARGVLAVAVAPHERACALEELGHLLFLAGRLAEARPAVGASVQQYRALGSAGDEGRTRGILGTLLLQAGDPEAARAEMEAGLRLLEEAGDTGARGRVLTTLALLDRSQGRTADGLARLQSALEIHRQVGARRWEATTLGHLGMAWTGMGALDEAERCIDAALAAERDVGTRASEAAVLAHLGQLRTEQGRTTEARTCFEAAAAAWREVGRPASEAAALGNLAVALQGEGRFEDALGALVAAIALLRDIGVPRLEAVAAGNLGSVCIDLGRYDEAEAHLEAALSVHRDLGNRRFEGHVLRQLGRLHGHRGRRDLARRHYEEALHILRAVGDARVEALAAAELALL